jgi:hypothetical protein
MKDDPSIGGLEGEQLPGIPEWTFSLSGNYDFMLGSLDAFVGGGIAYQDSRNTSFDGGVGSGAVVIAPPNENFTTDEYVTAGFADGRDVGSLPAVVVRDQSVRRVRLPARDHELARRAARRS